MGKSVDFWPTGINVPRELPPDPVRELKIERRRRLLQRQGSLLASLQATPSPSPGDGSPFLMFKSGGVWRQVVA